MSEFVPDTIDAKLLIGAWIGMDIANGSLGMMQFRFNDDGTFEFADYGRGRQKSGTYAVHGHTLVLQNKHDGIAQRRRIVSHGAERVVFEFAELGTFLDFQRDRPAI